MIAKTSDTSETLILEIKGNSLDDGPGIRSVVFFKGCPLSCAWCHNPESKRTGPELSFDSRECIGCDTCVKVCPCGALDRRNPGYVDRARCDLCFKCVQACPAEALSRVGTAMSVAAVLEQVSRDIPFYRNSGGGVTLSGGEPTLFSEYAGELLAELKGRGIHTLVETCGHFQLDRFLELIYPWTDELYIDLKLYDTDEHRRLCGAGNERILANFLELHERALRGGVPVTPRVPLIPEMT
ncbi:MAG: glycyl-radical enzyme activating protein, partial [Deltaproteobacteria bacterium HGW-Deltaproteobacteria-17]